MWKKESFYLVSFGPEPLYLFEIKALCKLFYAFKVSLIIRALNIRLTFISFK